jgi:SAM-dependent methyltransferase
MLQTLTLEKCSLCGSGNLEIIADLPTLPLAGIFMENRNPDVVKGFDQVFNMCPDCGHMQLANVLSPPALYGEGYAHRSSISHLSAAASDFFIDYIGKLAPDRVFDCILEIGCNDFVLLEKLSKMGKQVFGIDPIWIDETPQTPENATVIGGFVEDIDIGANLGRKPDLIVSTHNLEHIVDPVAMLKKLLDLVADDGLLVMEIPDSESLVKNRRFDQVSHQHIHYLTLATFLKLIKAAGGTYIDHSYNYANWGGSVSVAFTRDTGNDEQPDIASLTTLEVSADYIGFKEQMARFMDQIRRSDHPMVGYGAGQMLPVVAYHLDSNLDFLDCIYDDDINRNGLYYPFISPQIMTPAKDLSLDDRGVVITSLDGVRAISNRLRDFSPRFIYVPISVY